MTLVSIDTETTGLDPERHEAWEVALVLENGEEACWHFPVQDLLAADAGALQIGDYYRRTRCDPVDPGCPAVHVTAASPMLAEASPRVYALRIAELTDGATLMGCNPHFDAAFLAVLLRRYGLAPAWSHRFMDLGSLAAGVLETDMDRPHASSWMADLVVANDEAHTALGDARWNWTLYWELVRYRKANQATR